MAETELSFLVPVPPSTNNLYVERRDRKGRARTSQYKAWIEEASLAVAQQRASKGYGGAPLPGPLGVRIEAPFDRRRDLDNIKPALDLMVTMGVIIDDRQVDDLRVLRVPKATELRITLWPMKSK